MTQQFIVDGAGGLSTLSVWHVKVTYFGWQRSGAAAAPREGGRREGFGGEAPAAAADMTRPSWEGQQWAPSLLITCANAM